MEGYIENIIRVVPTVVGLKWRELLNGVPKSQRSLYIHLIILAQTLYKVTAIYVTVHFRLTRNIKVRSGHVDIKYPRNA